MTTKRKDVRSVRVMIGGRQLQGEPRAVGADLARQLVDLARTELRPKGIDGKPVRCAHIHPIAWSAPYDLASRTIRADLLRNGWAWYIETEVMPALQYAAPADPVVPLNPFGCLPGEDMQADQAIHALESGNKQLQQLVESFAPAWRQLAAEREVIAYLGNLGGDREFSQLVSGRQSAAYLHRLLNSYGPILSAGCSVAFDVLVDLAETHPAVRVVRLLQSLGVRCYGEPLPASGDAHLADLPRVVMEDYYQRHHARTWPRFALPKDQLRGELLRVWNLYRAEPTSATDLRMVQFVASAWAVGHTAGIQPGPMLRARASIDELVAKHQP